MLEAAEEEDLLFQTVMVLVVLAAAVMQAIAELVGKPILGVVVVGAMAIQGEQAALAS